MLFDYEEFTGKKGLVRIMNLEEYWNALPDSEKHENPNSDELQCTCPYCSAPVHPGDSTYDGAYMQKKLYIHRGFKVGFCFRCNTTYITSYLDLKYEIPSMIKELGAPSLKDLSFKMLDPVFNLSLFKDLPDEIPDKWLDKLYDRNPYTMNLYDELGFKYVPEKYGHEGVLIPFYWKGEMIYYQIWQYPKQPKYWCPPTHTKSLYICGPIKKDAILVEGVFDAVACRTLYPDKTPIAVLGCTVTHGQCLQLKSLFLNSIVIRMDDSNKSYKVYNRIKNELEFTDLSVLESDGTDPEEELLKLIETKYE